MNNVNGNPNGFIETEGLEKNRMVSKKPNGGHNDNDNEKENEEVGRFASYAEYRKAVRRVNMIFTKK